MIENEEYYKKYKGIMHKKFIKYLDNLYKTECYDFNVKNYYSSNHKNVFTRLHSSNQNQNHI